MIFYTYWVSTALLSLLYFASAFLYLTKPESVRKSLGELGYTASTLIPFMIIIKLVAPVVIVSRFNVGLSDLAYAGILFHLILSALAHLGVKHPAGAVPAVIGLILLVTSFLTQNAVRAIPSPYGL